MPWIKAEISDETHRELRIRAAKDGRALQDVAADVLEAYLNEEVADA